MTTEKAWQPAYLLHARAYRETSVLAEWFLPEQGRVGTILRGARRKGQSIPAPFQPFFVQLAGMGELKQVHALEPAGPALALHGSALFSGLYLNELLVRLLPRELPQPELFIAYGGALGDLTDVSATDLIAIEAVLRGVERQVLEAMGQTVSNSHQADTHEVLQADQHYQYYPEHGWLPARAGQRGACAGADILAVGNDDFSTPERRRLAKVLYRLALEPLLAGKPLKSRDLFAALAIGAEATGSLIAADLALSSAPLASALTTTLVPPLASAPSQEET